MVAQQRKQTIKYNEHLHFSDPSLALDDDTMIFLGVPTATVYVWYEPTLIRSTVGSKKRLHPLQGTRIRAVEMFSSKKKL